MKIVCVSDTHGKHGQVRVPDGDVLIHAGDLTLMGQKFEYESVAEWLNNLPHKVKVVVAGNHDFAIHKLISLLAPSVVYLENFGVAIDGVNFWGSPVTPRFGVWAYMAERGEAIRKYWDEIPESTDVLITHGPPYGLLDQTVPGHSEHLGCKDLRDAIFRVNPKVHVFGHIHGGYGLTNARTLFVNASAVDEAYNAVNAPIVVEL